MEIIHTEKPDGGAFEVMEEGAKVGEMTYTQAGEGTIVIEHTEVDPSQNGKGLGKKLVDAGVAFAREKGLKIIPVCPFAKRVLEGNGKYADVVKG